MRYLYVCFRLYTTKITSKFPTKISSHRTLPLTKRTRYSISLEVLMYYNKTLLFENPALGSFGRKLDECSVIEPMFELRHRLEKSFMSFASLGEITK